MAFFIGDRLRNIKTGEVVTLLHFNGSKGGLLVVGKDDGRLETLPNTDINFYIIYSPRESFRMDKGKVIRNKGGGS